MKKLSEKQLKFIWNNFQKTEEDIRAISDDDWYKIREESFYISVDELVDKSDEDELTDRCLVAESIADMKYSELMESA